MVSSSFGSNDGQNPSTHRIIDKYSPEKALSSLKHLLQENFERSKSSILDLYYFIAENLQPDIDISDLICKCEANPPDVIPEFLGYLETHLDPESDRFELIEYISSELQEIQSAIDQRNMQVLTHYLVFVKTYYINNFSRNIANELSRIFSLIIQPSENVIFEVLANRESSHILSLNAMYSLQRVKNLIQAILNDLLAGEIKRRENNVHDKNARKTSNDIICFMQLYQILEDAPISRYITRFLPDGYRLNYYLSAVTNEDGNLVGYNLKPLVDEI